MPGAIVDEARQAEIAMLRAARKLAASLLNGYCASSLSTPQDIARLEARLANLDERLRDAAIDVSG